MLVLIVDDYPDMTELISYYLEDKGHTSISADFFEAEKTFNENCGSINSIIININPWFVNQIERLEKAVREKDPDLPIIYITNGFELMFFNDSKLKDVNIIHTSQLFDSNKFEKLLINSK